MESMKKVGEGKIIEMKYVLRKGDKTGEVMEVMDEQWPLKFLFGEGMMLPVFEEYLLTMHEGQQFEFTLAPEDAYGQHDPNQVIQLFKDDLKLSDRHPYEDIDAGDFLQMHTQNGQVHAGKVIEKTDAYIVIDCNHALAGMALHFEGQILFIREARKDELDAGRYIEPNGFRSHSTLRLPPNE